MTLKHDYSNGFLRSLYINDTIVLLIIITTLLLLITNLGLGIGWTTINNLT